MKEVFLVGSSHFNHNYEWLSEQIEEIKPDCITIEQTIEGSGSLYWSFKHDLKTSIKKHKEQRYLGGEFSAGIHYAREHNIHLFYIDEIEIKNKHSKTNLITNNNFEVLKYENRDLTKEEPSTIKGEDWSERNKIMSEAINYHLSKNDFNTIVHIGGKGHYDNNRCETLQDMLQVNSIEILDADKNTRTTYK